IMYIIDSTRVEGEEALEAVIERMSRIITDRGGEIVKIERWGKKHFAYEIANKTEGYYVVMTFTADREAIAELERVMRISDDIVRHLMIRKEAVAPPAAAEAPEPVDEEKEGVEAPAG
ncbi:MAG TPA: 30S ribosomal protein S6, partial [Limnochordia bacterium]